MSNVYEFPVRGRDTNAFTPRQVLFCVSCTLGRQLTMTVAEMAAISFGLTDEGDGWLSGSNIMKRQAGWIETVQCFHIEKNAQTYRAKFSLDRSGLKDTFENKSLTAIFRERQPVAMFDLSYAIFMHHKPLMNRIYEQMNQFHMDEVDRPVVSPQRTGGFDLTLDYGFLADLEDSITGATEKVARGIRAAETDRAFNGR